MVLPSSTLATVGMAFVIFHIARQLPSPYKELILLAVCGGVLIGPQLLAAATAKKEERSKDEVAGSETESKKGGSSQNAESSNAKED
mmetsp:Transcript_65804/g.157245  ORF Transcript_65804/g.157245 Transcript_65804/m.157245 type:complete len:87 (+) Transcript_65804:78-338(+)